MGIDRVPFVVTIKEVGFHREDSEVGDKIRDVWHTLQAEKFH